MLHSDIIHLPAVTQSGTLLGRVERLVIDPEAHLIQEYVIRSFPYILPLCREIIIHRTMVVSIAKNQMIVEDTLARESSKEVALIDPVMSETPTP